MVPTKYRSPFPYNFIFCRNHVHYYVNDNTCMIKGMLCTVKMSENHEDYDRKWSYPELYDHL